MTSIETVGARAEEEIAGTFERAMAIVERVIWNSWSDRALGRMASTEHSATKAARVRREKTRGIGAPRNKRHPMPEVGDRNGRRVVVAMAGRSVSGTQRVELRCDCGSSHTVTIQAFREGGRCLECSPRGARKGAHTCRRCGGAGHDVRTCKQ